MEQYLQHHGILGQKWGKKNGPPYPLNYDDLSSEEREKAKKDAYDRADVKEAYANRKYFSNQEIDDIIVRFKKQNDLLSTIPPEIRKTGADKIKDISNTLATMGDALNKAGNAIEGGTRAYNALAKVLNTFAGTNLKQIKDAPNPYNTDKLEFLKKQEEYKQQQLKTEASRLANVQTKWNQDRQQEKYDKEKEAADKKEQEQIRKEKELKKQEKERIKKEEEAKKNAMTSNTANNSKAASLSTAVNIPEKRDTSKDNVRITVSDKPKDSSFERIPESISLLSKNNNAMASLLSTPVSTLKSEPPVDYNTKAAKGLEALINYGKTGKKP